MKSSTNRALVAKKQSTSFAQMANNLLNVLQGCSKSIRLLLVMLLTLTVSANAWGAEATLSFANKAQRTSFSTTKQVWEQNGVTFTNDKASSTNAVADYASPVRLYANSSVTVACSLGNMTKIVFDCNNDTYATAMKNSIGTVNGATVTVSSDKVTVTFTSAVASFTVAKLSAQVRLDSITVTYEAGYNITYVGDEHITYTGTKPETIKKEDDGFELEFSVNDGYQLDDVQVKMGGQNLVVEDDYYWEEGYLLILPETDITGDIVITFVTVSTCTTSPTVSAGSNSNVTTTTATVSCSSGITSLGSAGCPIESYGFVYGTSSNPTISNTKVQVGTTYTTTSTAFSKELTGLTANTTYYVRPYATNGNGTAYGTQTSFKTLELPKYTVTLNAGPGTCAASVTEASAGAGVTLLEPTLNCGDWKFAGWAEESVSTETTTKPTLFAANSNYKPKDNITLCAVYQRTEETPGTPTVTPTTDKLTRATTGVSGTSYSAWSGKTSNSDAVYAGNSAGGNDAIQLRSKNSNSGVITTASGGKAKKVTVEWESNTASGRTLDIYGKNSAYSAVTDLYDNSKQGTKLGSIKYGTSTELTIDGDYEYIGLRSNSDAMYITSISIEWESTTGGGTTTTTYYHSTPDCGSTEPTYTLTLDSDLSCVTDGSATVELNATELTNFTPATRDGFTCSGYWSAPSGGVKVLNADGTFAATNVQQYITDGKWINTTATELTPRWECSNTMTLSFGTQSGGTYSLSKTSLETCDCEGDTRQVTITATPNSGYSVTDISYSGDGTATKVSGPTVNGENTEWVYQFNQGDNGSGTFTVTFTTIPTYTITWMANGQEFHKQQDATHGTDLAVPSAPDPETYACDDKVFVGWTATPISGTTDDEPADLFTTKTAKVEEAATTYYAVFATAEGAGFSIGQSGTFKIYANVSGTNYYAQGCVDDKKIIATNSVSDASDYTLTYTDGAYTIKQGTNNIGHSSKTDLSTDETTWTISEGTKGSWRVSSNIDNARALSYSTSASAFKAYATSNITADGTTYYDLEIGGGTTYSDYSTTCVKLPDPVLSFETEPANPIEFTDAVCGGNSSKQSVTVVGENLRDVVNVSVTGPYKIARTSSTALKDFTTSLTLDKTAAGAIHSNYKTVYIISTPPAQSTEATTGTLTFTTTKGNTLTVNLSTPTVTCTQYTLTLDDRGTKITAEYYAGASVPKPADPTGVCTDPIHYEFDGWATSTVAGGSTTYTKVSFPYTMPAKATTLYAVYRYTEGNTDSDKFMSVDKEIGELVSGVDYVLTGYNTDDKEYALSCTQYESGKYKTKQIDVSESTTMYDEENPYYELTTTDNEIIWTITGDDENGYSFQNKSTGKYLNIEDGSLALNNSDPTKYTIEHYVGYDSELGKYVQYLNVIIQPLEDDSYYLSSYYKNSTAGVLFNLHSSSTLQLYLYKRAAATLYTTSPACGPMLEITSGKDIYVTSGYGTGRNTVIAQQTVEYRATRLKTQNGSAGGKAPDVKVTANGITIGGEVTDKVKVVELTQNKELIGDKYTITGTVTIQYTPKANHLQEEIQVQLAVDYNSEAKDNFTVHARSLPAEFVIAAKQGDNWYALNGDMSGNDAEKANGYLQVDDIEDPTKATFAPCNTIYTFDGMVDGGNKEYMRFQGIDGKYLWAASAGNTGIQNYAKNTPTAVTTLYNWQLYTSDNETYQLQNEGNGRKLGLSKDLNFGMYSYVSTLQQDIRILPIEAKCIYNYAPTNLKVSVLKSTSVTLTWDAVAGATKYQYRTDATSWTDAGTEPTVTINALKEDTDYTYYIRAYHEDAGVSQECIDYAEITFTTANCDDVPTNITYTADLNSITVSWTAAAPTATIKLFMNEDGTGGGGTYPGAKSPYKISGGLDKNTTYYIQILAGGTCASQIIPVKTEDVEVDIVEWYPQGIIVDINTDETVGVSLENEVSYGSGVGAEATELFFSKYYEATANVKLVALYNGTKNIIDLTNYEIHYGNDSWEKTYITLKDFGSTKGQIQPGEELILYTTGNTENDTKIMNCVHNQYPDGKWVEVTSSNNTGKGTLSFAGKKTLVLKKAGTIIDVIGALDSSGTPTTANAKTKPSWGDDPGWTCDDGLSIADDTEIGISTNRCLLVRNNDVTSGANAVERNIDDFVTLCSEWKGAQVPDNNVDKGVAASCENFAYVGTFDYSDYYTKYVPMGEGTTFDENDRNDDGTVTIPITDLYKHACSNIRVKLTNSNSEVLSDREYKVPIMITTTQGTDGQAFLALQENLATKEVDGQGNVINTYPLSLDEVREICKTCDVVIRDNATLQKMADDAENDHPQVRDIYVYENSSLIVPNGTNYTINNLSLRRKEDAVASVSAYPEALILPESAAAPISLDFRLSAENWHWFTLPYDCNINEVKWIDGTPAQYNVDWFLMTYDGKTRAETQTGGNWKAYTGTTIKAGEGFILAINGNINNPKHTYELRFPMSKDVLVAEGIDKTVDVRAWGVETNIRPNHKGWNLVGNPYLAYYLKDNINSFEGLRLGELVGPNPQTGYWTQTGDVPYVVVPIGAGYEAYEQLLASETDLLPFTAYFVQVGNDGTHNSSQDLKVSFDHTKLQLSATPMPASIVRRAPSEVNETEEPVIVGVALTNSLGESDKTSLVIADRFTNEYEMQADFFKWFGDYYNYYTKPVLYTIGADQGKRAFNALNEELAKQPIPMGMYAAQAGNYTFSLNQQFDLSRVEEVWLYDATQSTYTNLMQSDYTFSTSKVNGAGRFSLSVKLAPKVATSIDNVTADKVWATTHTKQVIVNGLENGMHLWLYDATGKLLYNEPTRNYQHTYSVPQTGTYFVSVMNGNQKQTIKVVVE